MPGSTPSKRGASASWLLRGAVLWLGAHASARAQEPAPADAPPSAELLLYLAEFGDAQEGFVDPTEVDEAMHHARSPTPAAAHDDARHDETPPTDDDAEHDHDATPHR